jgi:uncharacterized protein YuzE
MKITYDPKVDALYIRFPDGAHEVTTQRLSDEVAVNYAPDGRIVGIEVLDASTSVFATEERTVALHNLTPISV